MGRFRTLRRYGHLLSRYLGRHRGEMALLALILCAAIGVQVATPLIASDFVDGATAGRPLRQLILLALMTIVVALVGQGVSVAETLVAERVSWAATNEMRADLLGHLLRLDAGYHNVHPAGESIERVDGDVGTLARFFSRFVVYVAGNLLLVAGVLALLYRVDLRIGLGLTVFVGVALLAMLRIRAAAAPSWASERQATADFYGFVGEYLSGLEDVRSSGAGAFVLRRCAQFMRAWWSATVKAQMRGYAMFATSEGLFGLGIATSLAVCAVLFRGGALTVGAVYLVFVYSQMLRQPAEQLRNELQDLQRADASMGRIEGLLATRPGLLDGGPPLTAGGTARGRPRGRLLRLCRGRAGAPRREPVPPARARARRRRPDRKREDHAGASAHAPSRPGHGLGPPERRRPSGGPGPGGAFADRPRLPGREPLQRQPAREPHRLRR